MSKQNDSSSQPLPPVPAPNFVYDFLYHDIRRIGSFLAQFQTYGMVQNIRTSEAIATIGVTKGALEVSGGIPLIAQMKGSGDTSATDELKQSTEQTFDPFWKNAQLLLDYLQSNNLIVRGIMDAGIGRFVLIKGKLSVVDLSIAKKLMDSELTKKLNGSQEEDDADEDDLPIDLLRHYPMGVQATMKTSDGSVWCSLREEFCSTAPGDLLLQHGTHMPGEWNLLGILDATAEDDDWTEDDAEKELDLSELALRMASNANGLRPLLGRPATSFGVTPLMIFRGVSG